MPDVRTVAGPVPVAVAPRGAPRLYRPEPQLGPPTASQTRHLAAARALDVGPLPGLTTAGMRPRLAGVVDGLGFRVLRRLFSGAHRAELDGADYYALEGGWLERSESAHERPEEYFPAPPAPCPAVRPRGRLPDGGSVVDLSFASAGYATRASARRMLRRYPENAEAHARCFRHPDGGRPAVLWLHGWGMGFFGVEAVICRARRLYDLGLDVFLYLQPYHARRRPRGVVFAGEVFPTTDMARTNEGFLQAVWETRSLAAWHHDRGGGPVGVMGLSLGGYLAAVLASVAPETAFAVCLLPVADVPALMWSNGEGTAERRWAEEAGVTFEMFCRSMAVHAPLAHRLAIPRDRVMLVGARGDQVIPPVHTEALWEHWGRPALTWMPGSHLAQLGRRATLARVETFLRDLL